MAYAVDFEPLVSDANGSKRDASIMPVYEGLASLPTLFTRSSVTIGTFDGVHRGHQALIRRTVADARTHGRPAVVLTFDCHPMELFRPEAAPKRLTTPAQRNAVVAELGVACLIVAHFDRGLAELSADEFMVEILKGLLGMEAMVEGADFCFGKGRAGDLAYLQSMQGDYGFTLHTLKPVLVDGIPVSSTRIRESLLDGEIASAEAMLGREFRLVGRAVSGQSSNRASGYATVHLEFPHRQIIPASGSYAVLAQLDDGRELSGVCAIRAEAKRGLLIHPPCWKENFNEREMALRFIYRIGARERFDAPTRHVAVREAA